MRERLEELGFVLLPSGKVRMTTDTPTPCNLEGYRRNEVSSLADPEVLIPSFWICKYLVTNQEYERLSKRKKRPPSSLGDKHPATEVTYLNALSYAEWLSELEGIEFDLPTEMQWVYAAAPFGWAFPYREEYEVERGRTHNFNFNGQYGTVPVDDPLDINHFGLYQMGGNVMQMTKGTYYTEGHLGFQTDGMYCILRGGDFGHCPISAAVQTRAVFDVSHRDTRVGFRLVCNVI